MLSKTMHGKKGKHAVLGGSVRRQKGESLSETDRSGGYMKEPLTLMNMKVGHTDSFCNSRTRLQPSTCFTKCDTYFPFVS